MNGRGGLLERLLDWAVGASRGDRLQPQRSGGTVLLVPACERATAERSGQARLDYEREIELRVLMSTWM
jgi:hypothetical protein